MTPVGFEIDRRCLFFLYNSFLLTLLIQRSMFLSADIIQINVLIQQNHQSSTARFFLPLFVKEIETYGKKNRHLLVLYVFFPSL